MKIGIVGCGAIGSYYGAKLLQAGNDVWFLLRSDYEEVKANGVFIETPEGDFRVRPHAAREPEEIGVCDAVFIGLKTTANGEFKRLLSPLVDGHTLIVTLQNGLGNEEALAEVFGPENVLGGLCFVCLNRIRPGHIRHIEHGNIMLGEFGRNVLPRTKGIAEMFESVGVGCKVVDNLERAHWDKLIWNIPYNGLGVAGCAGFETVMSGGDVDFLKLGPCLPTDKIHADKRWEGLLVELMAEVIAGANAQGLEISSERIRENVERTQCMGDYWASTLLDYKNGKPLELESMFRLPLQKGTAAGAAMPRLAAMCRVIEQLDEHSRSSRGR